MLAARMRASLSVPVMAEGRRLGRLSLVSQDSHAWSQQDAALLEVAGRQVGSAAERLGLLATIQEQAALLQRILDTVRGGIFTLDADRRVLVANPTAREQLALLAGVRQGEVLERLGGRPFDAYLTPREDGLPHEIELEAARRRIFEVYPNPVEVGADDGGWTVLLREVTEVRQVQRRVQEQERRASVGQLAAGIAHDFNNIVAAIILYTEMLLGMPDLPPRAQDRLATIIEQAQRAATLVRQVLDFSRRGIMEPHPMDLVPMIKELVKLLDRTLPENIRIHFKYGEGDYVVNSDPGRVQQVFMNLAFNARDAMPSGGDLVFELDKFGLDHHEAPPLPGMPPGDWVRITVSDTGIGIPEEQLGHVFEPFFTTKPPGEGTGLGLAQVFGIVRQHQGFIDVESEPEEGTTFHIYLPAVAPEQIKGIIPEVAKTLEGQMETILVVEDDQAMREALTEMLEAMSYHVLSAGDGREALRTFDREGPIDLVLSDLIMPEMGGVALYEQLKRRHPDVRMVVMTGYPLAEEGKELLEQGIVAWVQKPLDVETLAQTLRSVLFDQHGATSGRDQS
jgi:signal transduction histidine kinase/CheY-like chemotaxis protein